MPASSYKIDVYRLGYYGGWGARRIALTPSAPQNQPACYMDATSGLIDCGNWSTSAMWTIPAGSVSGVYLATVQRDDTRGANHIPFLARDDASHSDLVFQTSDTTWQAYNNWGGNSLYTGAPSGAQPRSATTGHSSPTWPSPRAGSSPTSLR
jgi:N,N-dimethylformamidase beta subunit-like protein